MMGAIGTGNYIARQSDREPRTSGTIFAYSKRR